MAKTDHPLPFLVEDQVLYFEFNYAALRELDKVLISECGQGYVKLMSGGNMSPLLTIEGTRIGVNASYCRTFDRKRLSAKSVEKWLDDHLDRFIPLTTAVITALAASLGADLQPEAEGDPTPSSDPPGPDGSAGE